MSLSEQKRKLQRYEQTLSREENFAREKRLRNREGSALGDIHHQHEKLAEQLGITLEKLYELLNNPAAWIAFIEAKRPTPSTQFDDREDINNKSHTTKKSPYSDTTYNTENWDPGFKYGAGGRKD